MQKIMFNDKYGLTEAVLMKRKTQTRRIITKKEMLEIIKKIRLSRFALSCLRPFRSQSLLEKKISQ